MTCVTKYVSVKKTGVTKSQIGDVQRWEKKDRRPILIGGGVVFLLLILAGAFFIGLVLTILDTFFRRKPFENPYRAGLFLVWNINKCEPIYRSCNEKRSRKTSRTESNWRQ